ncbi:homoserine kinase [Phytoactinopolyspora alkaliphila]|uniref:Homoserine kinase n=1 Tax=Phytoactinopolyspora alkaliphila TaxID=1783498 RepID=A0A6N9YT05_9ACTN|nr:homoserine kinase [Phytoactinopolyspora alkaliphila]
MRRSVTVRVPATSANLGPGFDTLGLALGLHDVIDARADLSHPVPGGRLEVRVTVEGSGADDVPLDESHLVVRSMRACFDQLGVKPAAIELHCRNALPHGRGMGSSSAAIVGGVLAARALCGSDVQDDDLLDLAARLEGHPDNVAPCLLGGFTIAWNDDDGTARAAAMDVHPDIVPVVCIPAASLATEAARGLLPASVPHADAARNAGRAALLVEAVTRRPALLFDATDDRLHQLYRRPAMPETIALVQQLRQQGLAAVVSGAGPSVLVLASGDESARVSEFAPGWDVRALPVDAMGAAVDVR